MPSLAPQWGSNCLETASGWGTLFLKQTQLWRYIFPRTSDPANEDEAIHLTDTPIPVNLAEP